MVEMDMGMVTAELTLGALDILRAHLSPSLYAEWMYSVHITLLPTCFLPPSTKGDVSQQGLYTPCTCLNSNSITTLSDKSDLLIALFPFRKRRRASTL